jgi:hypothetical protein
VVGIPWTRAWCFPLAVFVFILGFAAWSAWHDTMRMLDFMVRLPPKKRETAEEAPIPVAK